MKARWSGHAGRVMAVGVLSVAVSAAMSPAVTATNDSPSIACPARVATYLATVHYSMQGSYPDRIDQLADDGFHPPGLSSDGLTAASEWWTLRLHPGAAPMFSCD